MIEKLLGFLFTDKGYIDKDLLKIYKQGLKLVTGIKKYEECPDVTK